MSSTREPELDRDAPDIAALKQGARVVWAAGDYPAFARTLSEAGAAAARRPGESRRGAGPYLEHAA